PFLIVTFAHLFIYIVIEFAYEIARRNKRKDNLTRFVRRTFPTNRNRK
ncbi:unnamed protein product, partial [marine sediment metagenome]